MRPSYRGSLAAACVFPVLALIGDDPPTTSVFVGFITDTECGPDHAPMIAKGGMGKTDRECTSRCVEKGATFGFVDEGRRRFYQLDDQEAPRPYAGEKVRIEGTLEGDTIRVGSIARAN
jgi:hypothetical protein